MTDDLRDEARIGDEAATDVAAVRSEAEDEAVEGAVHLSPRLVYEVILREGEGELVRPRTSLLYSGLAAGICISFSVIGEAILRANLPPGSGASYLVENLGYSLGFLMVIMGRLQLFTENTITTVMPVLKRRSLHALGRMLQLWGIVLGANVVGCVIAGAFIAWTPAFPPEVTQAVAALSRHAVEPGAWEAFFRAIPAGLLVAALVWMMAAGERTDGFWLILVFTWAIAAGDFTHVVAGSVEMAFLLLTGELGLPRAIFSFFLPVLAGNVVGGTAVFTMMAWGQVREEVAHRPPPQR
ncbi:formate/nitrite transporter family protein [Wenxinia saemankumensis]|uniref:Formate/nitrite transporter FocA, FNT family n=1 Tax=Wenxinia saemankumensis TaxID=1447782 RepID=A0A1M6G775_9RHOB|nr:formate/nitrite transporter family protein [Wenxinia saemankumensis]SHJ05762.1 Formate/nitrite transporter FocA, FNT family [Wenxinia saemankumensis]